MLIIGGGLAGILTAYMLEGEGIDYMLLEGDGICQKTTANTTAKITSQHGLIYDKLIREFGEEKAKLYYLANEDALSEYRRISEEIDCGFRDADSYIYEKTNTGNIEKERIALKRLGIDAELVTESELPFPISSALKFKNQACFDPLKFISCISKKLNIYEGAHVLEMRGTTAFTKEHRIDAKKVVVATHFPFINKHGLYFLKMYQHRSYVIALKNAGKINGLYLDGKEGGLSFRRHGELLLLGGGGHRTGKGSCAFRELEELAKNYYPESEVVSRWATQDCMTLDGIPYIGRYSASTENTYVATGFNKWGMTSSMVAARLISDMICGRKNRYEELFSPSRSIIRPKLAVNTFEALSGWINFTKKRCPHLGCALKWNKYERSWDCSCHGSRFDENGKLIDGPANESLRDI